MDFNNLIAFHIYTVDITIEEIQYPDPCYAAMPADPPHYGYRYEFVRSCGDSVIPFRVEFGRLATENQALNLGQVGIPLTSGLLLSIVQMVLR